MILTIVVFIITLLILVLIHELGHFLTAKKFNIKVLEFGFGIPPKAFGKKVGETEVSLNYLPIGGFVRLLGEDETDKKSLKNPRSFASQTVSKRIAVVVAGVLMNLLLAWLIFYGLLFQQGFKTELALITPHKFSAVSQQNEPVILIQEVAENSPAKEAGLKPGDRILAINNTEVKSSQQLIEITSAMGGQEVELTLSDVQKNQARVVKITPRAKPPEKQGPIGVALGQLDIARLEFTENWQKLLAGPIHSWNLIVYSGEIIGMLINESFKEKSLEPVSRGVGGPVILVRDVNILLSNTTQPVLDYLNFMALLSLNLAVFNILPIPALDGGRLFFLLFEAIFRKKVSAEVEKWVHSAGMAFLLTLILLITFSDIRKIFN